MWDVSRACRLEKPTHGHISNERGGGEIGCKEGNLGKKVEKLTCRNQLIRPLPSTEPERIAVRGEVEDLPTQTDSKDIRTISGITYARLAVVRAELLREEAVGHETVSDLGSKMEALRGAGPKLAPL